MQNRPVLDITVCDDLSAVPPPDAWNGLVDNSTYPNVFRRWEWISTWWKWFGEGRELSVAVIRDGEDLVGIAPWYLTRKSNPLSGRELRFIGSGGPTYPEYLGPIIHRDYSKPAIAQLSRYLRSFSRSWDAIEFPDIPPDDFGTNELIGALREAYPALHRPGDVCLYVELPETYEMLLGRLSSHSRQRKKRQLRRAREECKLEMDVLDDIEPIDEYFSTLIDLSTSSRARMDQPSPFSNDRYYGFHREVIDKLCRDSITRVYSIKFHGHPVAFLYGYLFKGKFYAFQTGFNNSEARFSPGDVLYQMIFIDLIERKALEFDFLRGDEGYKCWFGNKCRATKTVWVYRRCGSLYLNRWLWLNVIKPFRSRAKRLCWTSYIKQ
jgi:CelD/BcsL family acetyltransferase involved in cellulose biosynthesis